MSVNESLGLFPDERFRAVYLEAELDIKRMWGPTSPELNGFYRDLGRSFWSCGSPIELYFLVAAFASRSRITAHQKIPLCDLDISCQPAFATSSGMIRTDFILARLRIESADYAAILVEVDGHNFHDRTKQQAQRDRQRDRTLLALGHPVVRFTGSEVWRDPFKCADDAFALLLKEDHWCPMGRVNA